MKIRASFVAELVVNFALPWLVYRIALPSWGELGALYASAVLPILWSLVELFRNRRIDALSALVLLGIALSCAAVSFGGSPRLLLMRESLVSGCIGVAFLMSLLLEKPLTFYLARATVARQRDDGAAHIENLWIERPAFRRAIRFITLVWGVGLTGENILRAWLAWHWPIERYLIVAPLISYGVYGGLLFWTFRYRARMRDPGTGRGAMAEGN
ncbi:VC0807 family protein [Burkholderia alba]|uniref:VC0807 family protein n=1 Tax=Burkholderia alba TaxID=2683677 RepID=UPI002B05943D|nr:VC0807 family protein [Burkholderia alba]